MNACTDFPKCGHYTFYGGSHKCELAGATCSFVTSTDAEATYAKYHTNYLYSKIVDLAPHRTVDERPPSIAHGRDGARIQNNHLRQNFSLNGTQFTVRLPMEGGPTSGILWADPCISGRWIGCAFGEPWDSFHKGNAMLNALTDTGCEFYVVMPIYLFRLHHATRGSSTLHKENPSVWRVSSKGTSCGRRGKIYICRKGQAKVYIRGDDLGVFAYSGIMCVMRGVAP